ncbi:MAG: hypothetical protein ACPG4Z_01105 [Chitinophagales bacterium]
MESLYNNHTVYDFNLAEEIQFAEGLQSGKLWICYSLPDAEKIRGEERNLLINILKAAGYTGQNAYLVNINKPVSLLQLKAKNEFDKIIFFGIHPKWLGLNILPKKYKICNILEVDCLFADELEQMKTNQKLKTALWKQMQVMFGLK